MNKRTVIFFIIGVFFLIGANVFVFKMQTNKKNPSSLSHIDSIKRYLGDWSYNISSSSRRWTIYDKDKEIGFLLQCDENLSREECLTLVPQNYYQTQVYNHSATDNFNIIETEYNVAKSADPQELNVIIRHDFAFVFASKTMNLNTLIVIQGIDHDIYVNTFKSRL